MNDNEKKMQELLFNTFANIDYALSDPTWDYCEVYECLQKIKSDISTLISYLSQHEYGHKSIDTEAKKQIDGVIAALNEAKMLM